MASTSEAKQAASDHGPLYEMVRDSLAARIESGELGRGDQLPSERHLCEIFGLSRVTVRRALVAMSDEGLIDSVHGRGWFVSDGTAADPRQVLKSFSSLAAERGLHASSRVLECGVRAATLAEADRLRLAPGAPILELRRVRFLEGLAVSLERSLVACAGCPSLTRTNFEQASLYATLAADSGLVPMRAECQVEARPADDATAELLGLAPGAPVLVVDQLTYDQRGIPLEHSQATYRGDRHRFKAVLTAE